MTRSPAWRLPCDAQRFTACRRNRLELTSVPLALTCGWHGTECIVDPAASELPLLSSAITVVLDAEGDLLGVFCKVQTA